MGAFFKDIRHWLLLALILVVLFGGLERCSSNAYNTLFKQQAADQMLQRYQPFKKARQADNTLIADQKQLLLTRDDAIAQGLLRETNLKKVINQLEFKTRTTIKDVTIPFENVKETIVVTLGDTSTFIYVPHPFDQNHKWYSIGGWVTKKGIEFDHLTFRDKYTVTLGYEKQKFLQGIFNKPVPVVELKSESDFTDITAMGNVTIKEDPKKWYQKKVTYLILGILLGVFAP